jgi:hypothetical protein
MGLVNFYRSHFPRLAHIVVPICATLSTPGRYKWSADADAALQALKSALTNPLPLKTIKPGQPLEMSTDASAVAIGGALFQAGHLVGIYSRKLIPAERNYSTFDREALAIVASCRHFRTYLLANTTTVYTDHKPLVTWLSSPPVSDRHARWLTRVQELNIIIRHIDGAANHIADYLSRIETQPACVCPVLATTAAADQRVSRDPHTLISAAHDFAHPGIKRTLRTLHNRGHNWRGMAADMQGYVLQCQPCQTAKVPI